MLAIVKSKPEFRDYVISECQKLIDPARKENGCISYEYFEDLQDKNTLVFCEKWESHDLWQAHMKSEHLTSFSKNTDGKTENWTIYQLGEVHHVW